MRPIAEPLISCVMVTADRPKLAEEAIWCFRFQSWPNKELIVYDSGETPLDLDPIPGVRYFRGAKVSLGELRNAAIERANGRFIAHWDDDDWSHSRRLADQHDLLTAADAEIVGYRSMVFHRVAENDFFVYKGRPESALGTSLFYKRSTWEKRKFPPLADGEDNAFCNRRLLITATGCRPVRMIARHHGHNSSLGSKLFREGGAIWKTNWAKIDDSHDIRGLRKLLIPGRLC